MIGKINHIRYSDLDRMLSGQFSKNEKINFFVNIEHLVRPLLSKHNHIHLQQRSNDRIKELISEILNVGAHYRKFFSNNNIDANVYMYIGKLDEKNFGNTIYNELYRLNLYQRFNLPEAIPTREMIMDAIKMAMTISEYIEGVYIIESSVIEPSIIPQYIMKNGRKNVLLTNDLYEYQYANNDNFIILRAKLKDSHIVTKGNVIDAIRSHESAKSNSTVDFDSSYASLIISGIRDKYRNIEVFKGVGVGKWMKTLDKLRTEHYLPEVNPSPFSFDIAPDEIISPEMKHLIKQNYFVVDIPTQEKRISLDKIIKPFLTDRFDKIALQDVADMFTEYPINMNELHGYDHIKPVKKLSWD